MFCVIPLLSPVQLPVAIADSILWENKVDFAIILMEKNFFLLTDFCKEYLISLIKIPKLTLNKMLTFESVKNRLDREQPLTFLEFNYMLLQAYDFYHLKQNLVGLVLLRKKIK